MNERMELWNTIQIIVLSIIDKDWNTLGDFNEVKILMIDSAKNMMTKVHLNSGKH